MSTDRTRGASLRAALILNAVFLALTVVIVRVGFESNDDPTLAAFVDGQMANSTAYVPYINIVLGALLKGIYTVLGREIAWHTFCQYTLLYLSFTALSFVLCERLGALRGAAVTSPDPRGGAALVAAALGAEGESVVTDDGHIPRGYDGLDTCLRALGADIWRE